MRISGSAILWPWLCAFAVCSSSPCFSQAVQQLDYREKTQSLSTAMHATLDELKEQQKILENSLTEAKSDLKLSQGQVRRLLTECNALNTSLMNTNARLSEYSRKLTVSEHSRKKWVTSSLIGWGIIIGYVVLKVLKFLGKLHIPFI